MKKANITNKGINAIGYRVQFLLTHPVNKNVAVQNGRRLIYNEQGNPEFVLEATQPNSKPMNFVPRTGTPAAAFAANNQTQASVETQVEFSYCELPTPIVVEGTWKYITAPLSTLETYSKM